MKRWFLVGLVACASSQTPAAPRASSPPAPAPPTPVADAPAATVTTPATRRAIEAPPAGAIAMLAATDDGTAALTADELGGVRLWPALDGSREPRVVDLPQPKQLAIGASAGGFTVAALDAGGGLIVAQIDGDGLTKTRATLPADPPFAGIAMTARGALAWRTDHVLMLVAPDGKIASQLAAEPGQRITALAAASGRAIAGIDGGKGHVRWLTLAPSLRWGPWIATTEDIGGLALSPGGTRFATQPQAKDKQPKAVVLDATTGRPITTDPIRNAFAFAFVDEDHLAVGGPSGISWVDLRAATADTAGVQASANGKLLAAGGGHAIGALDGQLVIAAPRDVRYLGYDLQTPTVAAAGAGGQLLIGVSDSFAMLDKELRAVSTPRLALSPGSAVGDLRWLGGDAWLVESSATTDGTTSIALVDIARDTASPVHAGMTVVHLVMHEPSTQLVTLSLGETPEVDRYDPARGKLDRVAVLPKPKVYEQTELIPVSPQLAGGTQLIAIRMRDQLRLQWLRDPKQITSDAGALVVCCSLAAFDAAGHVYVWQTAANNALELAIYRDGKRLGKLPTEGPTAVWPEPSGARILETTQRSVSLYTSGGAKTWTQAVVGVTEAVWLHDGAIALVTRTGLARLDAATGDITAARCGWRFGLSPRPHPPNAREQPVCID